jgi:hypothetical protein
MLKDEDINFPTYRKYKNNKRFYKIINKKEFEEIQVVGSKTIVNHFVATQLPEFNLINDLISCYEENAVVISEVDYEAIKSGYNDQHPK